MKGMGASQGIAIGKAYIKTSLAKIEKSIVEDLQPELILLNEAIEKSRLQLEEIKQITESKMGVAEAKIFEAHVMILQDPEFADKIRGKILKDRVNASWAVQEAAEELIQLFDGIEDDYIKERVLDLKDVSARIIQNITGSSGLNYSNIVEPVILAAHEITPSDMSQLATDKILGIITEAGGITSHTVIMSRIMGLPAVVGVKDLLKAIKSGDVLIMDGATGLVYINPEADLLACYEKKNAIQQKQLRELQKYIGVKTITSDGFSVNVGCNIGSLKDLDAVQKNDGEGIGLFRSEFLFLDRSTMPTEDEQFEAYKTAAVKMEGKPVIIRTLDIGGDKQIPYMDFPKEENPFLGYRAIRYCLVERELFRIQLRAILRASAFGNVMVMLPMISSVEEINEARLELEKSMQELELRGITYNKEIKLGIMIETPAAALISDMLAKEADFFSIGTNDLTQYTLAVDRMNSKIADLYTPYHPAVLRLIQLTANNAKKAGIWVGMCGEAAQEELLVPVFVGMGLQELSVSPIQVLKIRKLVNGLNKGEMEGHVNNILNLSRSDDVYAYLRSLSAVADV